MFALVFVLSGCIVYSDPEAWDSGFEDASRHRSDGCELEIESQGDIKQEGAAAAVDFYARVDGPNCDPGVSHEIEMDEWDDGGGLSNPSSDGADVIRTGEVHRYTLSCTVTDDTKQGECGCTLRLAGTDSEKSVSLVID